MYRGLDPDSVVRTVERLRQRVHERFPGSGLSHVADELQAVARNSAERAVWTGKPLLPLRIAIGVLAILLLGAFVTLVHALLVSARMQADSASEVVQAIEAGTNEVVWQKIMILHQLHADRA